MRAPVPMRRLILFISAGSLLMFAAWPDGRECNRSLCPRVGRTPRHQRGNRGKRHVAWHGRQRRHPSMSGARAEAAVAGRAPPRRARSDRPRAREGRRASRRRVGRTPRAPPRSARRARGHRRARLVRPPRRPGAFPIPGSPASTATVGAPGAARSSDSAIYASSASRPTKAPARAAVWRRSERPEESTCAAGATVADSPMYERPLMSPGGGYCAAPRLASWA